MSFSYHKFSYNILFIMDRRGCTIKSGIFILPFNKFCSIRYYVTTSKDRIASLALQAIKKPKVVDNIPCPYLYPSVELDPLYLKLIPKNANASLALAQKLAKFSFNPKKIMYINTNLNPGGQELPVQKSNAILAIAQDIATIQVKEDKEQLGKISEDSIQTKEKPINEKDESLVVPQYPLGYSQIFGCTLEKEVNTGEALSYDSFNKYLPEVKCFIDAIGWDLLTAITFTVGRKKDKGIYFLPFYEFFKDLKKAILSEVSQEIEIPHSLIQIWGRDGDIYFNQVNASILPAVKEFITQPGYKEAFYEFNKQNCRLYQRALTIAMSEFHKELHKEMVPIVFGQAFSYYTNKSYLQTKNNISRGYLADPTVLGNFIEKNAIKLKRLDLFPEKDNSHIFFSVFYFETLRQRAIISTRQMVLMAEYEVFPEPPGYIYSRTLDYISDQMKNKANPDNNNLQSNANYFGRYLSLYREVRNTFPVENEHVNEILDRELLINIEKTNILTDEESNISSSFLICSNSFRVIMLCFSKCLEMIEFTSPGVISRHVNYFFQFFLFIVLMNKGKSDILKQKQELKEERKAVYLMVKFFLELYYKKQ